MSAIAAAQTQTTPPAPSPTEQMIGIIANFWVSRAVQVAAKLRLADHVEAGLSTVPELAKATGTHASSLYRLLRVLAGAGVFAEKLGRTFAQTPLSAALLDGKPGSVRAFMESELGSDHYRAWGDLEHGVRTGTIPFNHAYGKPVWEHYSEDNEAGRRFDASMTEVTNLFNPPLLAALDASGIQTLVDVGGGQGRFLASVVRQHPAMQGVLFDLPTVVGPAAGVFAETGVADRCRAASGDFFQSVPAGDGYLLKMILHDWDDARSTTILKNVRKAMRPGGRVIVLDAVLPPDGQPGFGPLMDLNMLVMCGGKERSEADFAALFAQCELKLKRVVQTGCPISIVEAVAA